MFSKRIEKQIQIIKSENFGKLGEARNSRLKFVVRNRKDAIKVKRLVDKIAVSFMLKMAYCDRCELHEWSSDYDSEFYEYSDDLREAYHERILLRNKYRVFSKIRHLRKYLDLIYKNDITQMKWHTCGEFAVLFNTNLNPEYKKYLYNDWEEDIKRARIQLPLDNGTCGDWIIDHMYDNYICYNEKDYVFEEKNLVRFDEEDLPF